MSFGHFEQTYLWGDESIGLLKQHYGMKSASLIMMLLPLDKNKRRPSRCAVVGKARRLGLAKSIIVYPAEGKRGAAKPKPGTKSVTKPKPNWSAMQRPFVPPESYSVPETLQLLDASIPKTQLVPLVRLTKTNCHWPIGESYPSQLFCGGHARDGLPYCAAHAHYAYRGQG